MARVEHSKAIIWDLGTGRKRVTIDALSSITSLTSSPDSDRLITAGADGALRIWQVFSGLEMLTISGEARRVASVRFSPKGDLFASSAADGIRLWRVATP